MAKGIEVGSVYVAVLPSARGFGPALMKQVNPEARAAGATLGQTLGQNVSKRATREIRQGMRQGAAPAADEFNKGFMARLRRTFGGGNSGVFRQLGASASGAGKSLTQITYGLNGVVPALTGAATATGRFVSQASSINPVLTAGIVAVGGMVAAVAAYEVAVGTLVGVLSAWGVAEAANLELLRAQTTVLLGSKQAAADYMSFVLAIAKESIVSTDALLRAGRTFAAYGVDNVNNVKALVFQLNNFAAAAGLGVDQVDNLALALAQIYSLGRLQGQEIRQLSQVGVDARAVLRELPKYAKATTAELKKAQEAGEISAEDFFLAWQKYTKKYEGAAKETSRTLTGLWQQLVDTTKIKLGQAFEGGGALEPIKNALASLVELVNSVNFEPIGRSIASVFSAIGNALNLGPGGLGITDLKHFFEVSLPQAIYQFGAVAGAVIGNIRVWIGALITPIQLLMGAFDGAASQASAMQTVFTALNGLAAGMAATFTATALVVRGLVEVLHTAGTVVTSIAQAIWYTVQGNIDGAVKALDNAGQAIKTGWADLGNDARQAGINVYNSFVSANSAAAYAAAGAAAGSAWSNAFAAALSSDESRRLGIQSKNPNEGSYAPSLTIPKVSIPNVGGGSGGSAARAIRKTFTDVIDVSLGRAAKTIWKDAVKFLESARKAGIGKSSGLYKQLVKDAAKIKAYAVARDKISKQLDKERDKLDALRDRYKALRDTIKEAMTSYAGVGNALISGINSTQGFLGRLRKLATQSKAYAQALIDLRAAGASPALIEQVAALGVDEGLKVAQTLLKGGKGAVGEANALVADVASVAGTASKLLAEDLFRAGIDAAKGIIAGLESQESELTKAMQKLANKMVKAIKKALGIKSPSAVMRDQVGVNLADGVIAGVESRRPALLAAMKGLVDVPSLDVIGGFEGSVVGGDTVIFIGNERLDAHIDYRVERGSAATAGAARSRRGY